MTTALHDYRQFVQWLHSVAPIVPENVRRFGNLVLNNFEAIAATSRQQSQRSVRLAEFARQHLAGTDFRPPPAQNLAQAQAWPWSSLRSLTIGPFRGFRNSEDFDLTKRIVMFYGPNGSGKTSLCEALEYALLGMVDEGEIKRISADRYLANVHEGRYSAPVLMATLADGAAARINPDAETNRFLFVEKNRIDAFSRIAAKPAGQKTELIATLFGMDQFNDFVAHFNDSMDGQLALLPRRQMELQAKRVALTQDQLTVMNELITFGQLDEAEVAAAAQYQNGLSYQGLLALLGTIEAPGRLQQLNIELSQPQPQLFGISSAGLVAAYKGADDAQQALDGLMAQLERWRSQVSFQDLYNAVLVLQAGSADKCPACDTPLAGDGRVVTDPYVKAKEGLKELRELSELQEKVKVATNTQSEAGRALAVSLNVFAQKVGATLRSNEPVFRYLADPKVDHSRPWWRDGYVQNVGGKSLAQLAVDYAQQLEAVDTATQANIANRQRLAQERDCLVQVQLQVATLAANRLQAVNILAAAKARINEFEVANAELISEVAREDESIARDTAIKNAYDTFLVLLKRYKTSLPGTLMAGLNTLAMELYNDFNRNDLAADKLAGLTLPTTGTGRIDIAFRGAPGRSVDALQVLSEGHLRCLGLAILMAKALRVGAPTIVFDDAINAIDHEHRQGIRETIFLDDRFARTQIIVTCHSNEFIKDIQNQVPINQWVAYSFRHHTGNNHPRVLRNVPSQNYLVAAREAVARGDDRSALGACRQALEMLTSKIWAWLGKYDLGLLTLKIGRAGDEPPLRTLCEALRAKINAANAFVHQDKAGVVTTLEFVLGIPETSHVWQYLNKGTHEEADRPDFDSGLVETIVAMLEQLNSLALRGPR